MKTVQESRKRSVRVKPDISTRTIQNLLGALYKDREFLEEVLHYEDNKSNGKKTSNSDKIRELAVAGLNFLDSRLEFWQQQQPMRPSRGNEALRNKLRNSQAALKISDHKRSQIILGILADLDKIDDCNLYFPPHVYLPYRSNKKSTRGGTQALREPEKARTEMG
ncbi:Tetratricopeptide repeat protein 25 [Cichlidogyrus casuarinus]|uniref:Tetratricopeptide repeat protein 25 n=1 Tax=Cichlidogyrus casuarinus TaxID=1844966 RepID=A0ABD2QE22_9PLAT